MIGQPLLLITRIRSLRSGREDQTDLPARDPQGLLVAANVAGPPLKPLTIQAL